jgi:aspartate aminotransferase
MQLSSRVKKIEESVTLKLNAKATELSRQGQKIYNLTAGQLPFRPDQDFIQLIQDELNFLKSFQYSPVLGFKDLRDKFLKRFEESREVSFESQGLNMGCAISNGGKHAMTNVLGTILNPDDEVILLAPYWVSYKPMIELVNAHAKIVTTSFYNVFTPSIDDIKNAITDKTRAIIINSPNNPTGVHYSAEWMKEFADLMVGYPDIYLINDEIYFELAYYDPCPTYFYQARPELLKQTIIVDGISKNMACTGLRLGYIIADQEVISAIGKLQGQSTSGANSLIQSALLNYDLSKTTDYLVSVKDHLRTNAILIKDIFRDNNLGQCWYQSHSAFYFLLDFSRTPLFSKYSNDETDKTDCSTQICQMLLEEHGIALVPGTDFGMSNCARLSLVIENNFFEEALKILVDILNSHD